VKVFALAPSEDWICDRFVQEWNALSGIAAKTPEEADVIWLLADWCWRNVPGNALINKTVISTVHHIVPDKFGPNEIKEFFDRDRWVAAYHVVPENKGTGRIHSANARH
jgi:hypothetical protein